MALFPSRAAASSFSARAPWRPRVGTYPTQTMPAQSLLEQLVMPPSPTPPPFVAPAPAPAPAPPITAGSVPFDWGGAEGGGLGYGDQPVVRSPDQSVRGMFGPATIAAGFPASVFGIGAGLISDHMAGRRAGTTTSLTDVALRAMNMPTTLEILENIIAPTQQPPAPPTQSSTDLSDFQQGFVDAGYQVDPISGAISGSGPFAGTIALSPDSIAALGMGPGTPGIGGSLGNAGGGGGGMASAEMGGGYGLGGGEYGGDAFGLRTGGYTGDGPADMPAGPVHKGEGVLNAAAMRHYGDAARLAVAAINARAVPKNKLAALVRG